jgi:serine phosphatase RsbU (regulator of sigma subunit)
MPLCDLASQMNQWSWDRSLEGRHFIMAFLAELDLESGALDYVSAGHEPPVIHRVGGEFERLELRGFPLGALATSVYEKGSIAMAVGDTLVVFTDGVVKAENHRGDEFGEDRILHSLRLTRGFHASAVVNHLRNSLLSFCGSFQQPDDLSFVVVRRCP